jgi:hypothetical protein
MHCAIANSFWRQELRKVGEMTEVAEGKYEIAEKYLLFALQAVDCLGFAQKKLTKKKMGGPDTIYLYDSDFDSNAYKRLKALPLPRYARLIFVAHSPLKLLEAL